MTTFELSDTQEQMARITVIGIGGAGGNAINHMIESEMRGVEFIACNTDIQALSINHAHYKVQIGKQLTKGLGAGARPEIGRQAIEEDRDEVAKLLEGSDMVFRHRRISHSSRNSPRAGSSHHRRGHQAFHFRGKKKNKTS